MQFGEPIFGVAIRSAGAIMASYGESCFETAVSVEGEDDEFFGFRMPSKGTLTLIRRGDRTTVTASGGLVYRLGPDTRLVTSDESVRTNVFVKATQIEGALEQMLDRRLRQPIEFRASVGWDGGLAVSLKAQLDFVVHEFGRLDGVAGNPIALAATTDHLLALILRAVPHNYTDQLDVGQGAAVSAYVRRAEDFMRERAAHPVRIAEVAAAAGCSVRTLNAAFRKFRGLTPLAVLHGFRLEAAHAELSRHRGAVPVGLVANRYGFTNSARFAAAFRRRFGKAPADFG
ncbi:helix-turn-helix domain-containing protein [Falsiroseomonas sp. HC035]|uniref:AraC family transcriptional regulator n=1 Tax=Falsiroseomonas sp. HC035 TaxID=3390999 RepID=UPI003D313056